MSLRRLGPGLVLGLGLLSWEGEAESSIRCRGRIVQEGDPALQVRSLCGEPLFVTTRTEVVQVERLPSATPTAGVLVSSIVAEVEEWLYLFEQGTLPRVLSMKNGRVHRIITLGPVTASTSFQDPNRCARTQFSTGALEAEVILGCGEPDQVDRSRVDRTLRQGDAIVTRTLNRERWIFNFGPNRLLREFVFENGRLVSSSSGGYGF
ncbi:MAG: DUF2845 domain-containing protein [Myxococcota bacterium]